MEEMDSAILSNTEKITKRFESTVLNVIVAFWV